MRRRTRETAVGNGADESVNGGPKPNVDGERRAHDARNRNARQRYEYDTRTNAVGSGAVHDAAVMMNASPGVGYDDEREGERYPPSG